MAAMKNGIVAAPLDRFRALLQRAGIDQGKPLYAVLVTVFDAAQNTREAVQEGRKPWTSDETQALISQLDRTLLHRWAQFNRAGIAIGVAMAILFGAACGAGGWWCRGAAPVLIGVRAGADKCADRVDGSRLCWIPMFERLPAVGK